MEVGQCNEFKGSNLPKMHSCGTVQGRTVVRNGSKGPVPVGAPAGPQFLKPGVKRIRTHEAARVRMLSLHGRQS